MKRVLREVVLGAVSCAALSVGVGAEAAFAQQPGTNPPSTPPTAPGPVLPGAASPAATPEAVAPAAAIRRINVEGNQRIEASTVVSYLALRPGDAFDAERIDLSLKTLFATNLFADVRIEQVGPDLVVRVVENPIVSRVIFEGVRNLKEEDLQKEVQAKPRSVFTAARAQADVQRIMELYRRAGRFAANVTPQVRELDQNRVDVIFEVDEGPVTGIRSINFIGNSEFKDSELREAIVTQQSRWWKFLSRRDNYDPDQLEFDREKLRQFYTNRGFADFRVVSAVAELTPDQKDFFVTFTIDEGQKYTFGEIKVDTERQKVPADLLRAVIPIETGRTYEGEQIEKSIDAMTFAAGTGGYANVDITPRVIRNRDARTVDITFEVNEGPRVFIDRIDVVGNTSTVDPVIRRELRLVEGDAFNRVLLDRSKSRVRALGFFKEVEITDTPGLTPDRASVEVQVQEDSTGELSFAAGYSSQDSLLFDVSVTQRNLRGRGQFLRLRASTSARRQQVDVRFQEPRFLGRNLTAGIDLYSLRTDDLDRQSFENQSTGLGLRTAFPVTDTTSIGVTYTLRQDDFTFFDFRNCPAGQTICLTNRRQLTSVAGYAFNWDRRNDVIRPTRGFDLSINQDVAGLGGEVKYFRTEFEGAVYRGLFPNVVASFRLSGGYITGWGGQEVEITDRFFKGGATFRGFDVSGLGPRLISVTGAQTASPTEFFGDARGGRAYGIGTLQLDIPLGLPREFGISGALFTEFGGVGIVDKSEKGRFVDPVTGDFSYVKAPFTLRASSGLSIFWESPFGPVQFDFAEPWLKERYDQTETFRFSTRTRF
jgi:outer membrane protein insertion porin family